MSDISPSAIKTTKTLEEQINACQSQAEVQTLMRQAALDQNLVRKDWDETILVPVEQPTPTPRRFAKTTEIAGKKIIFEGDSEIEVERQIGAAYKTAAALQPAPIQQTQQTEQPRNERGQFTAQQVVTDEQKAALSLQLQLGQIDISTFLERSGAVADYLENAGVPIEHLRDAVAEKQSERVTSSWKSATDEFLAGSGNWWPGGEINMDKMGKVLIEMGAEAEPSAENLRRAAEYLRDSNQLVEPPEVAAHNRALEAERIINEVTDPYTLRNMLQPGSSMFNR